MAEDKKAEEQKTEEPPEGLEAVLAELGPGEWKVAIHRHERQGVEWLDTWLAEQFSLEAVKDVFGGGKYRFRILNPNGGYHTSRVERIAGRSIYPDAEEEEQEVARAAAPGKLDTAEAILKLTERLDGFIHDLRHPNPAFQQVNPLELTMNIVGAMQDATRPMFEMMAARASQGSEDQLGVISGFLQGVEFARTVRAEIQEDADPSGPYDKVLKRLGDPLIRILERHVPGATVPGVPSIGGPSSSPNPSDPQPMILEDKLPTPRPAWVQYVGAALPQLVAFAERGKHPGLCAEFVVDELAPGHLKPVLTELTRAGFMEEFLGAVPRAAAHREWFADFYSTAQDVILELVQQDAAAPDAGEVGPPEG